MAGKPVTLKTHMHVCMDIAKPPPRPHVGGPVIKTKQRFVKVMGRTIACKGDKTICTGVPKPAKITGGSKFVRIKGKKIARMTDSCQHLGGKLVQGTFWLTSE